MADKFLKTMVMAGIFFLATTGLSLAGSFDARTVNDYLKKDAKAIKTTHGDFFDSSVSTIGHGNHRDWGKYTCDLKPSDFLRNNHIHRGGKGDGIYNLTGHGRSYKFAKGKGHYFGSLLNDDGYFPELRKPNFDSADVAPVPEPATMLLFGTGLIGLIGLGRRKIFNK